MKVFCLSVLVFCLFQGADEKPKVLDWSFISASCDKDFAEMFTKAHKEYQGKKVIAEGILFGGTSGNQRSITVNMYHYVKRGELTVPKIIAVTFRDVRQEPILALVDRKANVKVIGTGNAGGTLGFYLDDAQLFIEPKPKMKVELKTKPQPKKADLEATAAAKLALCKQLIDLDKREAAAFRLQALIREYPQTKAAEEAKLLLKKL